MLKHQASYPILVSASLLSLAFTAVSASQAQAASVTLGYWNFNNGSLTPTTSDSSADPQLSISSANTTAAIRFPNSSGSLLNVIGADPAGRALNLVRQGTGSIVRLTLTADLTGYVNPILSFATKKSTNGFNNNTVAYADDGSTFSSLTTYSPSTTFALKSFDFSAIDSLDDNANAAFRITFAGGTANTTESNFIDNIQLTAEAIPVPFNFSPALGVLMMGSGWGVRRLRRQKAKAQDALTSE